MTTIDPADRQLIAAGRGGSLIDPAEWIAQARTDVEEAGEMLATARAGLIDAVRFARIEHGWTWADVGQALGITRQAAQERFRIPVAFGDPIEGVDYDVVPANTQ